MKILDNINHTVREDLQDTMQKGSRVSIAAACFSIYAYQELKKQLEEIAELRFIFTSPTFVQENTPKERREFYIPKLTREKSLYGTEFEVRLRNELTQKALAKECADWVRRKVKFRSNVSGEQMPGFMTVGESSYMPISGFTTVDLGCERGNNAYYPVQRTEAFENGRYFLSLFDEIWNDSSRLQDVTDIVLQSISTAYRENSPDFIYFFTLYNIFSEFLEDVSEDNLPNEATGFKQSKIWNKFYELAFGDFSKLLLPQKIVFCEGDSCGTTRKSFDSSIYSTIFENTHPEAYFLSGGSCEEIIHKLDANLGEVLKVLLKETKIIKVIDRDDRSNQEVDELKSNRISVLSKRNLESYLLDDSVIEKLT